jgi:MFS family permease
MPETTPPNNPTPDSNATPTPEPTARRGSLLVIFLTVFIDLLGFGIVLPLLPVYAKHFEVDKHGLLIGLLMASFSAMQFFFAPLWGRLSDRIGRRPVLMIGLAGSVIFYTMFGYATATLNLTLLFVSRFGAGIMGATISTAQAYIADTTTKEKRSKGMALIGMAFGLGFTLGPLVAYLAVPDGTGRPGPLPGYAAAGLSAIALLLAAFVLPESRKVTPHEETRRGWQQLMKLREAITSPSIGAILLCIFICIFSFANFETTLSLLINESSSEEVNFEVNKPAAFNFTFQGVCLTYAFIGLTLSLVQGGIVRRLSGKVADGTLAASGAVLELIGFSLIIGATLVGHVPLLFVALAIVVSGFALLQPSLNALLSRRSDPARQGSVLGVGQSVSSLARIVGGFLGVPLLSMAITLPFYVASGLMFLGLLCILYAARSGEDYGATSA